MAGPGEWDWEDEDEADEGDGGARSIRSLRGRIDGFTPEKQKKFLKALRRTGCVKDAAGKAGISTTSIDRTRRKFADFDAACEAARRMAVPALESIAYQRATVGAPAKIIRQGKLFEVRVQPSDAMLRLLLLGAAPQKYGRYAGIVRQAGAAKQDEPPQLPAAAEVRERILRRIEKLRRHQISQLGYKAGPDGQLVPPGWRMVSEEELLALGWTPPAEGGGEGEGEGEGEAGEGEA